MTFEQGHVMIHNMNSLANCSIVIDACVTRADVLGRTRITWDCRGTITDIAPADVESDGYLARPGLIESHFHGFAGIDALWSVPSPEDWRKLESGLLSHGITGYIPAICFSSPDVISQIEGSIRAASLEGILGVFCEGTFVNPERAGGLPRGEIRPADLGLCAELLAAANGLIRTMLVSPEIDGACELIAFLRESGVIPAIGHSAADFHQAKTAIDAGAVRAVHWPNAMRWGDHHDPGIAVAVLNDDRVYVEVIGDNMHVAAPIIELAARCKGDKLVMISDSLAVAGAVDDPNVLAACGVEMRDGRLFAAGTNTHSGSYLSLHECCRVQLSVQDLTTAYITGACSANVAESLGVPDVGELAVGKRADIAVTDEQGRITRVYRKGRLVFGDA